MDDSSVIMKAADKVGARKASFNAEFLVGGGVFSYIPRDKLNDPRRKPLWKQFLTRFAIR